MKNIKIKIGEEAGFCFGVKRAVELVDKILNDSEKQVYCWGDLIHNPSVKERLEKKGLKIIQDVQDFPEGEVFVIRSHGISLENLKEIEKKAVSIIDTTCPFVNKAQKEAKNFQEKGFNVLILGDKNHPEVKGIESWARNGGKVLVINSLEELVSEKDQLKGKWGIVCQTTQKKSLLESIINVLDEWGVAAEVKDTICLDTNKKRDELKEELDESNLLIVLGGLKSSNTNKLAEIGRKKGIKTYHVEKAEDILSDWFFDEARVFLTAGASTPVEEIVKAEKRLRKITLE